MSLAPVLKHKPFISAAESPGQVCVELTPGELAIVYQLARDRVLTSRMNPARKDRMDPGWDNALDYEVVGLMAEAAVAKLLDGWWHGALVLGRRLPEDDGGWEVKGTQHKNGCLILHEDTRGDIPAVLGIAEPPKVRIAGWIWARDGKLKKWWDQDKPHPAYFVPQGALNKPSELVAWRREQFAVRMDRRHAFLKGFGA